MSLQLQTSQWISIEIAPEPLGEGAEGNVYEVKAPAAWQGYVVKIYKDAEAAPLKLEKIKYLIQHRPQLKDPYAVIFPEELVYNHGQFIGFLMKKAPGAYDLTSLCTLSDSTRLPKEWHYKYSRKSPMGIKNRMKVCYNVAAAFNQIHRTRRFTFVDIKPENIKISFDGRISIVDIDSISIADGYDLLFPAEKLTHEYSPAEYLDTNLQEDLVDETWDRFSISILFYKILFGLHPYAGTCKGSYENHVSNEQKIVEGLFPHGEKAEFFSTIPEPHKKFKEAPRKVRKLFLRCFEDGHHLPSKRPSAADWCKALSKARPRPRLVPTLSTKFKFKKSPKVAPKPKPKVERISHYAPHAFSGSLSAFAIVGLLFLITFSTVSFTNYWQMQDLRKRYADVDQDAKETPYQKKQKFVDQYDYVEFFREGIAKVMLNNKFGYMHESGRELTKPQYDWAYDFQNGMGRVEKNHRYGFVDRDGREAIATKYDFAEPFHDGRALVKQGDRYFFINKQDQPLFELDCDAISEFREGMAIFKKEGLYGYLDTKGNQVILNRYDEAYPFHEGLAAVRYYDRFGYINQKGEVVIDFRFDSANSFSGAKARVTIRGKTFQIDRRGKIIPQEDLPQRKP